MARGRDREETLDIATYFSDEYFSLQQLFSLSHQIHEIFKLNPKSILEVGIGNGMTSQFFRRAGYDVTTADINPGLKPDICAPLDQLPEKLKGKRFDLVVCCEVLEHMPFADFPGNLRSLRSAGDRLFMTLPAYRKCFGFGGVIRFPKRLPREVKAYVSIPKWGSLAGGPHFWEVGSARDCTKSAIVRELQSLYSRVTTGSFALNPLHLSFSCS